MFSRLLQKCKYVHWSAGSASDSDMDDNMKLPEDLAAISRKEKRELYRFKKQHTEVSA